MPRTRSLIRRTLAGLAPVLLLACGADTIAAPEKPVLAIAPGGGDAQTGVVGSVLPQPIVVQVTGVRSPNGQLVNFVVTAGDGSVFAPVVASGTPTSGPWEDQRGIAQNTWTLGPRVGPQTVEARLVDPRTGATLTQATFHATATAGAAARLTAAAGDQQTAVAGTSVPTPPAVLVTDALSNPVSGIAVTFSVTSGDGSITGPATVSTGTDGIAAVEGWTLGTTAGPNMLRAASAQVAAPTVTFTATGRPGSAAQLVLVSENIQTASAGSMVPEPPTVQVTDQHNNGVPNVAVTFTVISGGGSLDGVGALTTLTDPTGAASVPWTLGPAAGVNTLQATAVGLQGSPIMFTAMATAGPAAHLTVAAGDQQTAVAGAAVPTPPAVLVTDALSNPVSGIAVTFSVTSGGGSITGPATVSTGANGIAAVEGWTLGTTAGPNTLEATAAELQGSPITFTATATAGPAARLTVAAGDQQTAVAGTAVPTPPAVLVTDALSNPVSGIAVTFSVTSGGGTITGPATVSTGTDGIAAVEGWTLGSAAGENTLQATAVGLQGSPITFTATATAGPAARLTVAAGDQQTAVAGAAVPTPPAVLVTDALSNPVSGIAVTFSVTSGGGSITGPATVSTGTDGIAAVEGWTLGTTAGPNTLQAASPQVDAPPVTFTATGRPGSAVQLVLVSGNDQTASPGSTLPQPPTVRVLDQHSNGVPDVAVTFTVTSGGGSLEGASTLTALTDPTGAASVTWTLGPAAGENTLQATAAGLQGSPITFTATGAAAPAAPAAPSNLTATATAGLGTQIDLTWQDNATNEDGFRIERCTGVECTSFGEIATVGPNVTSYQNTGLSPGTSYSYRVRAHNAVGPSDYSNTATVTTPTAPANKPLYVANLVSLFSGSITVYAPGASGDATPTSVITGGNTGLSFPAGIALDGVGTIYVSNFSANSITVYAPGASGDATPTATIAGSNTGLSGPIGVALDAGGTIYVANRFGNTLTVYAAGANGNVTPTVTIAGSNTGLSGPAGIALDDMGRIYVSNFDNHSITVYAPGASGNATPTATIAGANTALSQPYGIVLDGVGKIYVANFFTNTVTVYAAGASGNATPTTTIAGGNTGLNGPVGIAVDDGGNIYVANRVANTVTVYAPGANGNVAPTATIAGSNTGLSGPGLITF